MLTKTPKTILSLLSLAATAAGCATSATTPQPPQAVQTRLVTASAAASGGEFRYSAVVMPDAQVPVSFRIPGYVVALTQVRGQDGRLRDVAEGDRVGKGTVLVRIRPAEYADREQQASAQAAAAEALAQRATLDFDRATRLYGSQSLTKPDLDAARAQFDATQSQVRSARAAVSEARIALRDTAVVAPFAGDVVEKTVEPGAFVGPGTPVLALARTDVVKIVIGVPDTTLRRIRLGQPVAVTVDALPDRTFEARVTRIASAADHTTRNFEVEVGIPNRAHLLRVGMVGSVQLATGDEEKPEAPIQVPLAAIVQASEGKYGVFVISGSGTGKTARLRPVDIGAVVGGDIQVVSGLGPGEEVITTGATLVKDGQRVEVLK